MGNVVIRTAGPEDAEVLDALIREHQVEGHLLPRDADEIRGRAHRFVVCEVNGAIKACAELAPLSAKVAEIRSLVVAGDFRRVGVAAQLVGQLQARGKAAGFETITAFTHDPRFFIRQNFSIVPHLWVPEKLAKDCHACPLFRQCGQYAVVRSLVDIARTGSLVPRPRRVAVA